MQHFTLQQQLHGSLSRSHIHILCLQVHEHLQHRDDEGCTAFQRIAERLTGIAPTPQSTAKLQQPPSIQPGDMGDLAAAAFTLALLAEEVESAKIIWHSAQSQVRTLNGHKSCQAPSGC